MSTPKSPPSPTGKHKYERKVSDFFPNAETGHFELIAGNSNPELAEQIAQNLGIKVSSADIKNFNDGECNIKLHTSVRDAHVFVIQSTCPGKGGNNNRSINDHIMELYLLVRCFRRASARTVTAVIPYYGYARQDEKTRPRVPIAASDIAMLLEAAGCDRILAVDLHSAQIQGQFQQCPVDNLSMFEDFAEYFVGKVVPRLAPDAEVAVVSPDADGTARAKFFLGLLAARGVEKVSLAITIRQKTATSITVNLVGDVQGKDCVIVDDIIDTGNRVCTCAEALVDLGAASVGAISTHGLFSAKALAKLDASDLDYVVVSDTIPMSEEDFAKCEKIEQVSCAATISEAIHATMTGESVEHLYAIGKE